MAESERLGASFQIDVTNLKSGLSQANRLIRESESQFKAAAAGMDDWQSSEAGLTAKIKSLNDVTAIQRTKIGALKQEYQNLINGGMDPTSREAVELRTQINNEEAALARNEAELRRQTAALGEVRNASNEAGAAAKESGQAAEEGGKGWANFGEIAKNAAKVAAAAIAAATGAVVALTKQAVESYAEYEQLVGGVDTLFGNSSQKVQDYAANAYKTAGLSANEYMETVTGMSASLIQSLGGDTEKAAEKANMAITDMSDNANKMGTDIESLQNAYGGFAKGNFTMLDNLKLGYGGTKEEMQRLLDDATKISGVKYDLNSYADVVDAINVVQTELGITGTTAKEASTTIQGSLGAMKSAWGNLLTGLADENANVDDLINNLIDSIGTFAQNLIPRISIALNGIVKLVAGLLPQIPPLLQDLLPQLVTGVLGLIQGIAAVLPQVVSSVTAILPDLLTGILGMLPQLVTAAMQIITELIIAITGMLPTIVNSIMDVLPLIITALVASIPQLLQAAIKLLMAIVKAIPTIMKALQANMPKIISQIVSVLVSNIPVIIDGAIQLLMGIVKAIPVIIPIIVKQIPTIIKGIVGGIKDGIPGMKSAGAELIKGLWNGIKDMKDWIIKKVKGFGDNILGGLKDFFGIHSPSRVMEDQIGKNLALGVGEGFKDNVKDVNKDIQSAMDLDDLNVNANINRTGAAGLGGGINVYQTNHYSQAHSRYELYKSRKDIENAVRFARVGV